MVKGGWPSQLDWSCIQTNVGWHKSISHCAMSLSTIVPRDEQYKLVIDNGTLWIHWWAERRVWLGDQLIQRNKRAEDQNNEYRFFCGDSCPRQAPWKGMRGRTRTSSTDAGSGLSRRYPSICVKSFLWSSGQGQTVILLLYRQAATFPTLTQLKIRVHLHTAAKG